MSVSGSSRSSSAWSVNELPPVSPVNDGNCIRILPISTEQPCRRGIHPAAFSQPPAPAETAAPPGKDAQQPLAVGALAFAKKIQSRDPATLASFPAVRKPFTKYFRKAPPGDIRSSRKSFDSVTGSIDGKADIVIVVSPHGDVLGVFTKENGQWIMRNVGDAPGDPGVAVKPSDFLRRSAPHHSFGLRTTVIEGIRIPEVQVSESDWAAWNEQLLRRARLQA